MHRKLLDLWLINVLAITEIFLAWIGPHSNQTNSIAISFAPLGVLFVLFLPGYALVVGFFPNVKEQDLIIFSIGLSIITNIGIGLILNLTPWGLKLLPWAVFLAGVIFIGSVGYLFQSSSSMDTTLSKDVFFLAIPWTTILSIAIPMIILYLALKITFVSVGQAEYFTQLWAVPFIDKKSYALRIGINSQEQDNKIYNLYIEQDEIKLEEIPGITIGPGQTWSTVLNFDKLPDATIRVLLYDSKSSKVVYRMVQIAPISFNYIMTSTPIALSP